MKIDIFLDLDEFDKKVINMSKEEKDNWCIKLGDITAFAERLLNEKKISKITYNRVMSLWCFSPHQNVNLMSSSRFNELMDIKNSNLKYIRNALNKLNLEELQKLKEKK